MYNFFKSFKISALLGLFLILIVSCNNMKGIEITGKCTDTTYTSAKLAKLDGTVISQVQFNGSDFHVSLPDPIETPSICELILINPNDPEDFAAIPVGMENGKVNILFGSSFKISGTSLNDKIYAFLSGLSKLRNDVTKADREIAISDIPNAFSLFYSKSIVLNYDNPLGAYIYSKYGNHLLGEDKIQAEQSLKR